MSAYQYARMIARRLGKVVQMQQIMEDLVESRKDQLTPFLSTAEIYRSLISVCCRVQPSGERGELRQRPLDKKQPVVTDELEQMIAQVLKGMTGRELAQWLRNLAWRRSGSQIVIDQDGRHVIIHEAVACEIFNWLLDEWCIESIAKQERTPREDLLIRWGEQMVLANHIRIISRSVENLSTEAARELITSVVATVVSNPPKSTAEFAAIVQGYHNKTSRPSRSSN